MSITKKSYSEQDTQMQELLNVDQNPHSDDCMICGAKLRFQIQTNVQEGVLWESSQCPACEFHSKPKSHRIQ